MGESEEQIRVDQRDHVALVTLDRPEALNAITTAMATRLVETFESLAEDRDVWVIVLRANGERAFCAGADLRERKSMSELELVARRTLLRRMFTAIREAPQPTVAAVFGHVVGGGFELALNCDLIVASEDASFGLPEGRAGLVPAGGGTFLLARAIGSSRAKEVILAGRKLEAADAERLGIVADVVPREKLDDAASDLAERICRNSPVATRAAKRAMARGGEAETLAGLEAEENALAEVTRSEDAVEGVRAFAERRDPRWENR